MFGIDDSPHEDARRILLEHEIGSIRAWDVAAEPDAPDELFVLFHGLGAGARMYRRVVEGLRRHGRVLVLDLPGFSDLPTPSRVFDIADFGRAAAEMLDVLGIRRDLVLLGHSMGAQVIVELVRHRPDRGGRVVLAAPVLPPSLQSPLRASLAFLSDVPHERPGASWYSVLGYVRCGPQWLVKCSPAVVRYPFHERVVGIGGRLVVLRGEHDPVCDQPWAERVAQLSGADATVRTVKGAAHQLMVDDADAVVDAVLEVTGSRP